MELLQRYSKYPDTLQRLRQAAEAADEDGPTHAPPDVTVQPHKIHQRLREAQIAELVAAYQAGAASTQLARQYGIGKATVLRLLDDAGVARRRQPLSPEAVDTAVRLYGEGWSLARIAERLGCDHGTVMRALERAGVPRRDSHGRER